MPVGQVTLGSGATQLQTGPQRAVGLLIQNNAAHVIRVGDSPLVSVTTPAAVNGGTAGFGIQVFPTGSEGGNQYTAGNAYLKNWYVAGTSGDVIDYLYEVEG
jgi:hypothetical protein